MLWITACNPTLYALVLLIRWFFVCFYSIPSLNHHNTIPNAPYLGRIKNNFYMQLTTNGKSAFCFLYNSGSFMCSVFCFRSRYCYICVFGVSVPSHTHISRAVTHSYMIMHGIEDFSFLLLPLLVLRSFHNFCRSFGCLFRGFHLVDKIVDNLKRVLCVISMVLLLYIHEHTRARWMLWTCLW